jgi:hypothetical protein
MCKPGFTRIFIPRTYIIHYIHHRHWRGGILVNDNPEPVGQGEFFKLYHNVITVVKS